MMESRISALVDGELEQEEALAMLASARQNQGLQQDWALYHLIGDSLRQTSPLSHDFNTRFADQLAQEPTILAPHAISHEPDPLENRSPAVRRFIPHNAPLLALSAAASVAAVSLVAWVALQFNDARGFGADANLVAAANGPANPDSSINVSSYLNAHQEYSLALRGVRPYQRASLEKPQDGGR